MAPGAGSYASSRRRLLNLARAGWLLVSGSAIALAVAGQPALFHQFRDLEIYDPGRREVARTNLAELGLAPEIYAAYLFTLGLAIAVTCFAVAAIIFIRRSDEAMALFVSLLLVLLGATFSGAISAPADGIPVRAWLQSVLSALSLATVFLVFFLFPDGRFVPRWSRWLALVFVLVVLPPSFVPEARLNPEHWAGLTYWLFIALALVIGVGAQIYRYRRISDGPRRQQTKWVILGFTLALTAYTIVGSLPDLSPRFQPGTLLDIVGAGVVAFAMTLIPLSFGVAILRYHLWDIDVVINRTLVYSLLTGLLMAVYLGSVLALQSLFRALSGQDSEIAIILSTLGVVVLFQPLRRRVQRFIDRRFYRHKYDAARTLRAFNERLRHEVDLPALTNELVAVVRDTMDPASVSLWIRPSLPGPGSDAPARSDPRHRSRLERAPSAAPPRSGEAARRDSRSS